MSSLKKQKQTFQFIWLKVIHSSNCHYLNSWEGKCYFWNWLTRPLRQTCSTSFFAVIVFLISWHILNGFGVITLITLFVKIDTLYWHCVSNVKVFQSEWIQYWHLKSTKQILKDFLKFIHNFATQKFKDILACTYLQM